jgi:uncharacterized membrane protein (DUF485 family)
MIPSSSFYLGSMLSTNRFRGGECMATPVRAGVSPVLGIVLAVGGLLVTIASFYLIIKMAGLVDALSQKIKEMKL